MGAAAEAIKRLTTDDIVAYEATGTIAVGDLELKEGELKARPCAALYLNPASERYSARVRGRGAASISDPGLQRALCRREHAVSIPSLTCLSHWSRDAVVYSDMYGMPTVPNAMSFCVVHVCPPRPRRPSVSASRCRPKPSRTRPAQQCVTKHRVSTVCNTALARTCAPDVPLHGPPVLAVSLQYDHNITDLHSQTGSR